MAETSKAQDVKQSVVQATKDSARATADATQQGGHAAGEALRHNADTGADVARRGAEYGAENLRRAGEFAGETTRRGTQAVVESQRQIVQDAADRFEEVSRKIAQATQGTTENVRRLLALPNAAEGGLRDFQQGWTGLFEGMVQTNLRAAQELFRLANPAPIVELQQRFVREYTDTLVQNSAALVRAMRRTADETLRPLEEQIRQSGQDNRADARFQTAAE